MVFYAQSGVFHLYIKIINSKIMEKTTKFPQAIPMGTHIEGDISAEKVVPITKWYLIFHIVYLSNKTVL